MVDIKAKFKVGDRIRIREWDDMASEYKVTREGTIRIPLSFTKCMEKYCNQFLTIRSIEIDSHPSPKYFLNWSNGEKSHLRFSEEMFDSNYKQEGLYLKIISNKKFNKDLL